MNWDETPPSGGADAANFLPTGLSPTGVTIVGSTAFIYNQVGRSITEINRFRRITLHTIAIGEFQKDFMQELARLNGGVFVDLGR